MEDVRLNSKMCLTENIQLKGKKDQFFVGG